MENRMKTVMGTKVNISRKDKSKGKIEIEYYGDEDFEAICEILRDAGKTEIFLNLSEISLQNGSNML